MAAPVAAGHLARVPSFCTRPGFPAGLQVLFVSNAALASEAVTSCVALLREAAYEVTECEAKTAESLLRDGSVFDVVLLEASDFFAATGVSSGLRNVVETTAVVFLAPLVEPNLLMKAIKARAFPRHRPPYPHLVDIVAGAMDVMPFPLESRHVAKLWQLSVRKRMEVSSRQSCAPGSYNAAPARRSVRVSGGNSSSGMSKGARGPSWTSTLVLPQPSYVPAVDYSTSSGYSSEGGSGGGRGGRVTRPRSRATAAQALAQPGQWAPAAPKFPQQPWGAQDMACDVALGIGELPAWCLGPLDCGDEADVFMLGEEEDLDSQPFTAAATTQVMQLPGDPSACYPSLQAQLAALEAVVAREAGLGVPPAEPGSPSCASRSSMDECAGSRLSTGLLGLKLRKSESLLDLCARCSSTTHAG